MPRYLQIEQCYMQRDILYLEPLATETVHVLHI